jgi:16S rRNA processing protein RimM
VTDELLSVGRVGRPHGLDGSFHVTQPRERVLEAATSLIVEGRSLDMEEDEWLAEDLVGCRVVDGDVRVGVVTKLLPYPSCELLEVQRFEPDAKALWVPLIGDAVRTVDVGEKVIDVNLAFLGEDA